MTVRRVRCAHNDDISKCPDCWPEFSGDTAPNAPLESTPNTPDQRIDEILKTMQRKSVDVFTDTVYEDTNAYDAMNKAKAALKSLFETMMAEVVGERKPIIFAETPAAAQQINIENQMLDTQRQRIPQILDKYFKGGK